MLARPAAGGGEAEGGGRADRCRQHQRGTPDHHAALFSRRTPLNFVLLFFTPMNRPLSLLRLVQAVLPISLPLSCERFRTAPLRALSPTGLLTAIRLLLC